MRTTPSSTLARLWMPGRSLVTDTSLVIMFSRLPAGWRLSRAR